MENTVETNMQQGVLDDAALNPVQDNVAEPLSDLSEITEPSVNPDAATQQQEQPPAKEPGWIKKRVDAAAAKASRETEARLRAEFDAILAPIRESVMDRQADELVRSGEFKSKERALEYIQLKNGVSVSTPAANQQETPRDAQGRFAPKQETQPQPDTGAEARIRANILAKQAEKIQTARGLDVAAAFQNNPQIQQKVLSGEWDFYDVAEAMSQRRVPAPMRTSNGASAGAMSIANMTDEQFARLNQNLAAGKIYDAR